jgi:hypothetical protein
MNALSIAQNNGETVGASVVGRPFPRGVSGNPGGRPKGLARYVRELVGNDGRRIADFMLRVLDDETERTETRMQAAQWLADRGFGKPTQPQALELGTGAGFDIDGVEERLAQKLKVAHGGRLPLADLASCVAECGEASQPAGLGTEAASRLSP